MSTDVTRWQQDAKAAFMWLAGMYEQSQTLWEDAERYFADAGWKPSVGGGLGGNAMSQSDLSEWPFIYLKALAAVPKDDVEESEGALPVFGINFHDETRLGPVCFAGTVRWADKPNADHWALYAALTGYRDRFRRTTTAADTIQCAKPTAGGAKRFPGIKEIRWFELPLGGINSAKLLKSIVAAAIDMAHGNDAEAAALARQT